MNGRPESKSSHHAPRDEPHHTEFAAANLRCDGYSCPPRECRPAWTLIELMAVLTVSSLLMGIVVATLLVVVRADRTWRNETAGQKEIELLADSFRRDIHRAEHITVGETKDSIELDLPDVRSIVYRRDGERLLRSEKLGEDPFGQLNVFRLGPDTQLQFDEVAANELQVATMIVTVRRPAADTDQPEIIGLPHRFDAIVGRDRGWHPR